MGERTSFNLQKSIDNWIYHIHSDPSFTESDSEELKCHLLDIIDELRKNGLDEEEAFMVAKKRLGKGSDWSNEYRKANSPIIQMRSSLLILSGVLVYFLCYYFIEVTAKFIFVLLVKTGSTGFVAAKWFSHYLTCWFFLFVFFLVSIYFLDKKTIAVIEKVRIKPKHSIMLFVCAVIFAVGDAFLLSVLKKLTNENDVLQTQLIDIYNYFNFSFPLLFILGFIFMYFKYYKKAKFYY